MSFSRYATKAAHRTLLLSSASAATVAVTLQDHSQEKLSIYPNAAPEIILLDTPSKLEQQIGIVRRNMSRRYQDAHGQVQHIVSRWIGVEHAVENRLKSFSVASEPLTPSLLYVGIATLTGSIIARNRSLGTRFLLPPTLFYLSMTHFLPETTSNVTSYISSLEETYMPGVAEKHHTASAHTMMGWEMVKGRSTEWREAIGRGVERAVGKTQEVTGLRVSDTLGWGRKVEEPKDDPKRVV